jgi:predicted amidohydrolase
MVTGGARAVKPAAREIALTLASSPCVGLPFARETVVAMTIACAQFAPETGAVKHNSDIMRAMLSDAARAGAAVVVFPELCLCGYPTPEEAPALAVRPDGPEINEVRAAARTEHVAAAFGFAEKRADGTLCNSMAFIGPDGSLVSVYRKVHLWVTEKAWAVPGTSLTPFDALGGRAGMWICYDTRFPETVRTLARAGAVIGLAGAAWFGPAAEWELALRSRALDNGIFVAGSVLLGTFGAAPFRGESMVVDPHGTVLAHARPGREELIMAECDMAVVDAFRARLPLFDDLRPGAYG